MTGPLAPWRIPPKVLGVSAAVAVVLLVPLAAGYLWAGVPAAIGIGMGYVAALRAGLMLRPPQALALVVPAAMAGGVAVALRGQPLAAAFFVALCCLLVAPANALVDSLMAGMPSAVALLVSVPGDLEVAPTAGWMVVGGVVVVALGSRLRDPAASRQGVPLAIAWRHAVVTAVAVGVVVYGVALLAWPHGYWVALTLTVVLRPYGEETRRRSGQRVIGTVAGALVSLLIATLLPLGLIVVALAACVVLTLAYTVLRDDTGQAVFMTPAVVLLGSAGSTGVLAAERVAYTVTGAAAAVVIAIALNWLDGRREVAS